MNSHLALKRGERDSLHWFEFLNNNDSIKQLFATANIPRNDFQAPQTSDEFLSKIQLICRYCNISFSNNVIFREHCKLESHVSNLRKAALLPDVQSTTSSGSSDPFILFSFPNDPVRIWIKSTMNDEYYGILKALITRRDAARGDELDKKSLASLISCGSELTFAVFLITAGHFSGVIFRGTQPVVHKAFHRYVIRAKQGHAQSKRDGVNRCQSGGSSLRRHNEIAFQADIQDLICQWSSNLQSSTCIFVHYPQRLTGLLFDKVSGALKDYPEKVRLIPFSLGRPTFELCKDVANRLMTIRIVSGQSMLEAQNSSRKAVKSKHGSSEDVAKSSNQTEIDLSSFWSAVDITDAEEVSFENTGSGNLSGDFQVDSSTITIKPSSSTSIERIFDEVYTSCRNIDESKLRDLILKHQVHLTSGLLDKKFGKNSETLLHFTSRLDGSSQLIALLLEAGCDPTLKDSSGKVPYEAALDGANQSAFSNFRATTTKVVDWEKAKVPVAADETSDVSGKVKKKRRKQKKDKSDMPEPNTKESNEAQEKEKFLKLDDKEKRLMKVRRCFLCGSIYNEGASFDYSSFKFCSVQCLRDHRYRNKQL